MSHLVIDVQNVLSQTLREPVILEDTFGREIRFTASVVQSGPILSKRGTLRETKHAVKQHCHEHSFLPDLLVQDEGFRRNFKHQK